MAEVGVERGRVSLLGDDVEVDVRSVAPAELRDDHRGPDDLVLGGVDQREDVLPAARILDRAGEALVRLVQDAADLLLVVGEVHRVEVMRDGVQLLLIGRDDAADLERKHDDRSTTPRNGPISGLGHAARLPLGQQPEADREEDEETDQSGAGATELGAS